MAEPNWKNRTIWTGDNLDIMYGMNSESIDLLYLDPPFNSNANYAAPIGSEAAGAEFKDTWSLSDLNVQWLNLLQKKPQQAPIWRVIQAAINNSDKSYLIYMAVRLLEMKRLLKPTASIYLHCDPTMSHYLKLLMDAIFGRENFRNDISWERTKRGFKGSQHKAKQFQNNSDSILFYSKSKDCYFNESDALIPFQEDDLKQYRKSDERGIFYFDTAHNRPSASARPNLCYEFMGIYPPYESGWKTGLERMNELYKNGDLELKGKVWYRKIRPKSGKLISDLWTDIKGVGSSDERTGYPTQKPLKLLDRIIRASSNEGDMVFDPFCGCATTLVAADRLERNWVGIDISEVAVRLVRERIKDDQPEMFVDITERVDIPQRTDLGKLPPYNSLKNKKYLYGEQEGHCNGCDSHFELRHFHVDHIIPTSKGGTAHIENLQLLCGNCNTIKGNRPQEYLFMRLADMKITTNITQSVNRRA